MIFRLARTPATIYAGSERFTYLQASPQKPGFYTPLRNPENPGCFLDSKLLDISEY